MTFPRCDIFEPAVYNGHQCYQVNIKKHQRLEGKRGGLMLLLDVNSERSIEVEFPKRVKSTERSLYIGYDQNLERKNLASIHIGTIQGKFTDYGPGDFALSSIKQMTGTQNFLDLSEDKRGCALQTYEECKTKGLLREITRCDCFPFNLFSTSGFVVDQVNSFFIEAAKTSLPDLLSNWHGVYARESPP